MTADPTAFYLDIDGGPGATFWVKESGINTNTGWSSTTGLPAGGVEGAPLKFSAGAPTWGTATELIPSGGTDGQPLLVSTGVPAWGDENQLVPTGGTPGQIVTINPSSDTALTDRDVQGGIALPLDFSDGSSHDFASVTIPGGALGPNGFVRFTSLGYVVTNATRTITLDTNVGQSITSGNFTSTTDRWQFIYELVASNQGSESAQSGFQTLKVNRFTPPLGPTSAFAQDFSFLGSSTDTTANWTFTANVGASGAITGSANISTAFLEYGYIG